MSDPRDLPASDLRLLLSCLPALYAAEGMGTYPERVFAALRTLIAADSYAYDEAVPHENRALAFSSPAEATPADLAPAFIENVSTHPVMCHWRDKGPTGALAISEVISRRDLQHVPVYAEFYRHVGVEDQLGLLIDFPAPMMVALACNRGSRSFTPRDHALLDLLQPHLKCAYEIAGALSRGLSAFLEETGHEAVIWLKNPPRIEAMTLAARHALAPLFPAWRRNPGMLPPALGNWLSEQIASLTGNSADAPARMRLLLPGKSGPLTVTLSIPRSRQGYLLILAGASLHPTSPEDARLAALPARQREVLTQLLTGASAKEAAARMQISVHTLNEHIRALYQRFDVSSRAELMSKFVKDH